MALSHDFISTLEATIAFQLMSGKSEKSRAINLAFVEISGNVTILLEQFV
jgi:hypothetical protein